MIVDLQSQPTKTGLKNAINYIVNKAKREAAEQQAMQQQQAMMMQQQQLEAQADMQESDLESKEYLSQTSNDTKLASKAMDLEAKGVMEGTPSAPEPPQPPM
jgi:FKBP-type peptidyl-prolyl cis-trans isomerase